MSEAVDFLVMGVLLGVGLGWSTGLLGRARGAALYRVHARHLVVATREGKKR